MFWLGYIFPPEKIAGLFTAGKVAFKQDLWLLLTYTANLNDLFHYFEKGTLTNSTPFFSHLWSLAIEEQYYLLFPFVVYFLSRRTLLVLLWTIIAFVPVLRLVVGESFRDPETGPLVGMVLSKVTVFHLDAFAFGGILAINGLKKLKKPDFWLGLFGLLFILTGIYITWLLRKNAIQISRKSLGFDPPLNQYLQQPEVAFLRFRYAFSYTLVNFLSALLIFTLLNTNKLTALFQQKWLVFTGKLAYSIYIFHFPVQALLIAGLHQAGIATYIYESPALELLFFPVYLAIILAMSWLSFHFFESYFLRLKYR